jgi:hypothetical protein
MAVLDIDIVGDNGDCVGQLRKQCVSDAWVRREAVLTSRRIEHGEGTIDPLRGRDRFADGVMTGRIDAV